MKSILGIGNALTDILAVFPDETMLREYHLPPGSMQHVDLETGDRIWSKLKEFGVKYVPGGSAANTITCTSIFGMRPDSSARSATTNWGICTRAHLSSTE